MQTTSQSTGLQTVHDAGLGAQRSTGRGVRQLAAMATAAALWCAPWACAQPHIPGKVDIPFNRYSTYDEMVVHLKAIAAAYPDLVELKSIGQSLQGREMWLAIVNNPKTGPHESKPAMYIEGNVHANEIQAGEVVLYSLWYLTKAQGANADLTKLLDQYSFYFVPVVNPDSRQYWFDKPSTAHFPRHNQRPHDDDRDGLVDEDYDDDLDGDGSITSMWKADPNGRFIRDRNDPRVFIRVADDQKGEWTPLGEEGIDNDGDGQINEDGPGGDDMNRNWPSDWQPMFVQFGAGPYPLSAPETKSIADFILAHPNIAGVQSYHNAGGMILRGPGTSYRDSFYNNTDRQVYDEIANIGQDLLPYYRSMVIYKDLYNVHGGFVNWTGEGLGIFSFTNELWTEGKMFQRDVNDPDDKRMWLFRDRLQYGQVFKNYTEVDHPLYGKVLVGGLNKWSSRNTPTFMLEEECHRNFAFTMLHADAMPVLKFGRVEVKPTSNANLWQVTVEVENTKPMPTRSGIARSKRLGANDILTASGDGTKVATAGLLDRWLDPRITPIRHEPERLQLDGGIAGRGRITVRYFVRGSEGASFKLKYEAEKARTIETTIPLRKTE